MISVDLIEVFLFDKNQVQKIDKNPALEHEIGFCVFVLPKGGLVSFRIAMKALKALNSLREEIIYLNLAPDRC